MLRVIILLFVVVLAVLGFGWYSSQSLPSWYQQDVPQQQQLVEQLSEQINSEGVGNFLVNKFANVVQGQLILSEVEFNALLISSLQSSQDGRQVLSVSDAVKAQLGDGKVEIGAVVDLDKVAKLSEKARDAVAEVSKVLPLLDQSKIFLSVTGQPIARNGEIAFSDNFSVKIGSIPISSKILAQMGIPVHKVTESSLPIEYISVRSIALSEGEVVLEVRPEF